MASIHFGCDRHQRHEVLPLRLFHLVKTTLIFPGPETMQWTHPDVNGDIPPPCRAHTATLVDRKIFVFGGGEGPAYYNDVYILDTAMRRWIHPLFLHRKMSGRSSFCSGYKSSATGCCS